MKIFDPLSTIIKLGILSKKPLGTKLSIKNNTIDIQEVSYYQGIYRYFNNDIDDDIQFLIKPIDMACRQYLSIEYIKKYPNIKKLFFYAIDGINNLIEIYLSCASIYNYLIFIKNVIEFYLEDTSFQSYLKTQTNYYGLSNNEQNLLLLFYNLWTDQEVIDIFNMMDVYINSQLNLFKNDIELCIIDIDNKINKIISNTALTI